MSLLPDPADIEAVADRITAHAAAVRTHAHRLALALGHTTWHGSAARAFVPVAAEVCAALRHSADRLDDAAAALRRHAARVRAAIADLRAIAHDLGGLAGDGRDLLVDSLAHPGDLLGDGIGVLQDAGSFADHALDLIGI